MRPNEGLLILEFETLGGAFEAVQKLSGGPETLELIPGTNGALLMVSGPTKQLESLQRDLPSRKAQLIPVLSESVVQAYLGLENPPLQKSFLCFESSNVAEVFVAAQVLAEKGHGPFDLRILRGGPWRAYVLATSGSADAPMLASSAQGQLTVIQEPSAALKEYFSLSPQ